MTLRCRLLRDGRYFALKWLLKLRAFHLFLKLEQLLKKPVKLQGLKLPPTLR